jgi:Rrf2 family transcriptional regulator, iron-sulfur cluster assembly transcription factor
VQAWRALRLIALRRVGLENCRVELNTRGRYAVMAMTDLAKHGAVGAVALSAIAERQNLSVAYLEQIFAQLRRAGLVDSLRGRSGGYKLGRSAHQIVIAEIMTAVQEETRMTRCLDTVGDSSGCLHESKCLTHGLWHALGDHIRHFFETVTLQDALDGAPMRHYSGPVAARTPAAQASAP